MIPPRQTIPTLAELPLVIDTPRVQLRPIAMTDVEDLWPHVSDPAVTPYISWEPHADRAETRAFVQRALDGLAAGTDIVWVIVHEGRASGCIGLHGIKWKLVAWRVDRGDMGYWIAPPLWNQGLMSEAALAATRWCFETLGLHRVTIGCIEENVASRRVIEKIGFRFLCRVEEDVWRNARWWTHLRYELTAGEWADATRTLRFNRPTSG